MHLFKSLLSIAIASFSIAHAQDYITIFNVEQFKVVEQKDKDGEIKKYTLSRKVLPSHGGKIFRVLNGNLGVPNLIEGFKFYGKNTLCGDQPEWKVLDPKAAKTFKLPNTKKIETISYVKANYLTRKYGELDFKLNARVLQTMTKTLQFSCP